MTKGEDHIRLEMLVDCWLVDKLYLLATSVVDLSTKVVRGFQEVVVVVLQEARIVNTWETKIQDHHYKTNMSWIRPT